MEKKCMSCQFYDRKSGSTEGRSPQWGQCRRTSPMLSAVSAKSYMIEGVWPTVRDDDWCGEWRTQSAPHRLGETLTAALNSNAPVAPRVGPLTSMTAHAGALGQGGSVGLSVAAPVKVGVAD